MVVTITVMVTGASRRTALMRARLARCTPDAAPGDRAARRNKEAIQTLRMRGVWAADSEGKRLRGCQAAPVVTPEAQAPGDEEWRT